MLLKETALFRLFGLRIPMILFLGPRVLELDDEVCAVEIPLGYRSRNHLGSMYYGALHAGADLTAGGIAMRLIAFRHRNVKLVIKDAQAEFLKRADGDVVFRTRDGKRIRQAVEQAAATGERVTVPAEVIATVPAKYGDEPVARFTLRLSVRRKGAESAATALPHAKDRPVSVCGVGGGI
jgi:acyl-coenzyme A thioesterase PaaI-like protein